jgi:DDE superfamily endonuclease
VISVITPVYVGKSHDFAMFKEENLAEILPAKTPIYTDTGFLGIDSTREDLNVRKPKKKPRNRKLNGGEQLGNRLISRERVKVEHAIGGVKRFRITSQIFRGISHSMNTIFKNVCGLWNLKMRLFLESQAYQ